MLYEGCRFLNHIYTANAMLSKKEIKDIQSLDQKKFRNEQQVFIAEGPKIVGELLHLIPGRIRKIYAVEAWAREHEHLKNLVQVINETDLEKIAQSKTPNQVLAVVQQWPKEEPVLNDAFCLYLDTIQDPGNFGTIIRIADWFGVKQVVCTKGCADLYNPKVVQASMASLARVAVYYDTDAAWLKKQSVPVYAATLQGVSTFSKVHTGILMIGNESKGIRPELLAFATQQITIPRRGEAESLNAAVATGILLSHLLS
jgi:TrmH family RNA methyltransferase